MAAEGLGSYYNEALEPDGEARELYRPLLETLEKMGPEAVARGRARADRKLRELGATFNLPGEGDGTGRDRILPADWMPRIIPKGHWEKLSAGLLQRGLALNAWLADLHEGRGDVVPDEVVESSAFHRQGPSFGTSLPCPVRVYGPDVVHLGGGEYVVLEDNARVPSGVAYSEAVRRAGLAALPEIFEPYSVSGIYGYYAALRSALRAAAPGGVDEPGLAVVTGGRRDPAFFEHERIAATCGLKLLTIGELGVRGGVVVSRVDGSRVDVIYRRFEDDLLRADLPELSDAYLKGRVNIVNSPGVGIADDKGIFPYVPEMIEHYLGEAPILKNAPTLSLLDPEGRDEALERLAELVLKPREGFGAKGLVMGPEADAETIIQARRAVKQDPTAWIAQEFLDFSTHVLDESSEAQEAFVDLRAFVLPELGYVMPGGLTRVARPGTRVVNSSAGGSFKDTWVLQD